VGPQLFHDFHHEWVSQVTRSLNRKLSGTDRYSLVEWLPVGVVPDRLTLKMTPPQTPFRITDPPKWYASKKKAVTIRHISEHCVVAVLEIVSPGTKDGRSALALFVRKAQDLLAAGVHLSLVDLFPPTPRDPEGIHPVVWGEDDGDTFRFDQARPLTCAAYIGGAGAQAFVEPVAVGEKLPDLAVFLTPEEYVAVPLEATYEAAFEAVPEYWRDALTNQSGA
jgi:hypothetical protein